MDRVLMILIGGIMPAIAFGMAAVFHKGATLQGVGVGTYLIYVGFVSAIAGLFMRAMFGEASWAWSGMPLSVMGGVSIALGTGGMLYAVKMLGAPISLITPITVSSSFITVIVGLIFFKEHQEVSVVKLLAGSVCVVVGAVVVATS